MRTNDLCRRTSQHAVLFWQTSPWIDESRVGRKFFTRSGVIFLRLNLVDTTLGGTVFLTFQVDKSVQYCERTVSQVFCHFTPPLYNDFCRTLLVCIPCLHHGLMLVIPCLSRWKFVPDTDKEDFWFPHGVRLQIIYLYRHATTGENCIPTKSERKQKSSLAHCSHYSQVSSNCKALSTFHLLQFLKQGKHHDAEAQSFVNRQ